MPPAEIWINGLVLSCTYMTMASGLVLIFSIMRLLNWSHGQLYMIGAYVVYFSLMQFNIPFVLSLILSALILCVMGIVMHLYLLRPIEKAVGGQVLGPIFVGVATIALNMLLEGLATLLFGPYPRGMKTTFEGFLTIGKAIINYQQIFVIAFTIVVFVIMYLVLGKTKVGLAVRATAQDRHTAGLYGVNVVRISTLVMGIGCSLAALAGGVVSPLFAIDPFIGTTALFMVVLTIIIGGMGSLVGAIVGGLILGFLGSVASYYVTYFYEFALFGLVIVILLVRPQGLFGQSGADQFVPAPGKSSPAGAGGLGGGKRNVLIRAVLVVALFCLPLATTDNFVMSLLIDAVLWCVATMGFVLILRTGQFSLGQAGILALGSYGAAILQVHLGWSFWWALPLSGVISAIICLLIGLVVLRIGGIYFAIITFSLTEVIRVVASEWQTLTGGYVGLMPPAPSPITLFATTWNFLTTGVPYYYLGLLILIASALVFQRIDSSHIGRAFRSIAVNPMLAEHQGIHLMKYRVIAYTVAGFFAGLAGGFYGNYLHYVGSSAFGFNQSTMITAMGFVGGVSSVVFGPLVGGALLSVVATYAKFAGIAGLTPLVFGGVVLAFLFFLKGMGLVDLPALVVRKLGAKRA